MSIIKSIKFKKRLTHKQQEFIKTKEIKGNFTLDKLLKIVAKSAQFDKINDKARRSSVPLMIISLVVGIILSIAFQNFIPVLLGGGLFAVLLSFNQKSKGADLDNSLREFTVPLLGILSGDIIPRSNLKVALCCGNPMAPSLQYDIKPRTTSLGRTITFYRYPWLSVKADMIDGSRLSLENVDELQKIDIKKKSVSGKIKYKVKYKRTSIISVLVEFPKGFVVKETNNPQLQINHTENGIVVKSKMKIKTTQKESSLSLNQYMRNIQQIFTTVTPAN